MAGSQLTTASSNICVGASAGSDLVNGSNNIYLGATGGIADNNTIHIGFIGSGSPATTTFIDGIGNSPIPSTTGVVVNTTTGQLGISSSSRVYKENIQDINLQATKLLELRPVTFNYKKDESAELHFGLIAEEVDELMPELVVRDKNGDVQTVKYHELPALLLAHIKQLNERITVLEELISHLK